MQRKQLFKICHYAAAIALVFVFTGSALNAQQIPRGYKPLQILFYVLRSRLNAELFRYDAAIADMDAAIALEPDNARLYVERGQRILLLYEWDQALADYERALELDSDYADAYYFRAVLYASVPEGVEARQAALDDFEHYLELAPEGAHAEDAARYADEIQAQLDALNRP